jgi:hypothetical protein
MGRLALARIGVAAGCGGWLDGLARFRVAQEVSVPDGSTPVAEVVIVA